MNSCDAGKQDKNKESAASMDSFPDYSSLHFLLGRLCMTVYKPPMNGSFGDKFCRARWLLESKRAREGGSGSDFKRWIMFSCAMWLFSAGIAFSAPPAGYALSWSDEFEGKQLDMTKWVYRTDSKHWSTQTPTNVTVAGGMLSLGLKKEALNGKAYTGSGVISKRLFKYGYYEAKFRVPPGAGWHTSFWLMRPDALGGTGAHGARQEIDICEQDSVDSHAYAVNLHDWEGEHKSYGHKKVKTGNLSAGFHVWGCEFTKTSIRYLFDGKVVQELDATKLNHGDHHIWLTSIASQLGGTKAVDDSQLPSEAAFDYVRFYEKKPDAGEPALPDPLKAADGKAVTSVKAWQAGRRAEILELFRTQVYGRAPVARPDTLRFEVTGTTPDALSGRATRKEVAIHYEGPGGQGTIHLAVYLPNKSIKPVPGFVLICNRPKENLNPTPQEMSPFWPVEELVDRGYMAAAFQVADLDPDTDDGFKNGVHGVFDRKDIARPDDAWGTIAAWAWGASRVMDYFESDRAIDAKRIGVVGHSRGGKAALWCGAQDERFALVISNESGSTGAALARGKRGESIKAINDRFPHWFCANYKRFNGRENELPVDQHELIALMAPRLVYVASAQQDAWSDPQAEFRACVHAAPVYQLFGLKGSGSNVMPEVSVPMLDGSIGYHIRPGQHDLTAYDWKCFMDFADRHWKTRGKPPKT